MTKPEIKACRDCKHYRFEFHHTTGQCSHPAIVVPSVICGGYEGLEAKATRHEGKCGIEAKYWEAYR